MLRRSRLRCPCSPASDSRALRLTTCPDQAWLPVQYYMDLFERGSAFIDCGEASLNQLCLSVGHQRAARSAGKTALCVDLPHPCRPPPGPHTVRLVSCNLDAVPPPLSLSPSLSFSPSTAFSLSVSGLHTVRLLSCGLDAVIHSPSLYVCWGGGMGKRRRVQDGCAHVFTLIHTHVYHQRLPGRC